MHAQGLREVIELQRSSKRAAPGLYLRRGHSTPAGPEAVAVLRSLAARRSSASTARHILHRQLGSATLHRIREALASLGIRVCNNDCGVVRPPAGEVDVKPRGIRLGANERGLGRLALHAMHGRRIRELQVVARVLGRDRRQLAAVASRHKVDALLTGLRVRSVNRLRKRFVIEENAVMIGYEIHVGTPKTHEKRSVPYPDRLAPLTEQACVGKGPEGLLFGDGVNHMRNSAGQGWFANAVMRSQAIDPSIPQLTPHDLRHTAASLAISSGANVKAVQRMLGHASAAMTLDTYADLFDDDLDAVAAGLNDAMPLVAPPAGPQTRFRRPR